MVFGGFQLEGAVLIVDDLPDYFVGGHYERGDLGDAVVWWVKSGIWGGDENEQK